MQSVCPFSKSTRCFSSLVRVLTSNATKSTARAIDASEKADARKYFIGENWKCNGPVQQEQWTQKTSVAVRNFIWRRSELIESVYL